MKNQGFVKSMAALLALAALGLGPQTHAAAPKVKVFLMAGQSNMQGKGSAEHLDKLVQAEPEKFGHLKKDGKWAERDDVFVFFGDLGGRDRDRHGRLTVGYGFPAGRVGPELGFGRVVGDAIEESVVLLKTCWGGQSLAIDFRSPSAGKWDKPYEAGEACGKAMLGLLKAAPVK